MADEGNDISNVFKRRKSFLKFIEDSKFLQTKAMYFLKLATLVFTALLIIICLLNHFVIQQDLNENEVRYDLLIQSNLHIADLQSIQSRVFD